MHKYPQALILTSTKESAFELYNLVLRIGKNLWITCEVFTRIFKTDELMEEFTSQIIIAEPVQVVNLIKKAPFLGFLKVFILDEVDRMRYKDLQGMIF